MDLTNSTTDNGPKLTDLVVQPETPEEPEANPPMSKGQAIVTGLTMIEDGLAMIARLGNKYDLVATLVGSDTAATKLRNAVKANKVFYGLVGNIVKAKNTRLAGETTEKVIDDFLDTLFDLSQPYRA
jgi:hypothetical protein